MFTHLHIYKSASAFGQGEFVGRAQIGCVSMAEEMAHFLQLRGYCVEVLPMQPHLADRSREEQDRVQAVLEEVMGGE